MSAHTLHANGGHDMCKFAHEFCQLRMRLCTGMVSEVSIGDLGLQRRLFGKNLENWSPNGLLLRSKSPYPLKFLAFDKKITKFSLSTTCHD